jgi:hypothetical protein
MTKDGRELDFLVTRNGEPFLMLEIKWADTHPSGNFPIFEKYFANVKKVQIVGKPDREKTYPDGTEIRSAAHWLSDLALN